MTGVIQTIAALTVEADGVLADAQGLYVITPSRVRQLIEDFIVTVQSFTQLIPTSTQSVSYQAVLADVGSCVEMNNASANNFTIPPNLTAAFAINSVIQICQVGAGATTLVPGAGVTLRSPSTLVLRSQWSTAQVKKRGTNEWVVSGDVT